MALNYRKNVNAFLSEIQQSGFLLKPFEVNGVLLLPIKIEFFSDSNRFPPFFRETVLPLAEKWGLKRFFKLSLINPMNEIRFELDVSQLYASISEGKGNSTLSIAESKGVDPNPSTLEFHTNRLKAAFQRVTREEVAESIAFLAENGWNDEKFTKEFNVSGTTLWRYRKKTPKTNQESENKEMPIVG